MHILYQKLSSVNESIAMPIKIIFEIILSCIRSALISELALHHQEKTIEFVIDVSARLMDRHYYCLVMFLRKIGKVIHDDERSQ